MSYLPVWPALLFPPLLCPASVSSLPFPLSSLFFTSSIDFLSYRFLCPLPSCYPIPRTSSPAPSLCVTSPVIIGLVHDLCHLCSLIPPTGVCPITPLLSSAPLRATSAPLLTSEFIYWQYTTAPAASSLWPLHTHAQSALHHSQELRPSDLAPPFSLLAISHSWMTIHGIASVPQS